MIASLLWLLAGILALYAGAELLVAGASRLAIGFGIRTATVGVTVIAFATTAPELFVATIGALNVSTDIGLGAVVGSNIANIGLVIGVSALIRPLPVSDTVLREHAPVMLLAAFLLAITGIQGTIGRLTGGLFLIVLAAFTAYLLYRTNNNMTGVPDNTDLNSTKNTYRNVLFVLVGLIALLGGSRWLIDSSTTLLESFGFSDLFIGLTVLSVGTALPELATSAIGAFRGETDFAIGNVIGSNIYNILAVLGIVALISPIDISTSTLTFEFPTLIVFTLLLIAMMSYQRKITRLNGGTLVIAYAIFVYLLFP